MLSDFYGRFIPQSLVCGIEKNRHLIVCKRIKYGGKIID